jgi:hypothetical protein
MQLHTTDLVAGILLCMDGLGELAASLLAWKTLSYNEDANG